MSLVAISSAYAGALARFPFVTKYCTTFWICCASVHLSQRLSGDLNLGRMFKYAALVGAPPYSHYWFLLLARFNVGPAASMVLDQVVWRPLTILWSFFVGTMITGGGLKRFPADLKANYAKAVKNGLIVWVPMQYINFRFVPPMWRVLFIDIVHFFWDIYLCMVTMTKKAATPKLDERRKEP